MAREFAALFGGEVSAYGDDESAADITVCNLLAFWTGRDADRMDRLFRQSGLMRPKWDSRRRDTTYGALTIDKAITDCLDVYTPTIEIQIDDAEPATAERDAEREADQHADRAAAPSAAPPWPVLSPGAKS